MITFSDSKDLDPKQLVMLFEQAEWAIGRSLEETQRMLAQIPTDLHARAFSYGRTLEEVLHGLQKRKEAKP